MTEPEDLCWISAHSRAHRDEIMRESGLKFRREPIYISFKHPDRSDQYGILNLFRGQRIQRSQLLGSWSVEELKALRHFSILVD